MRTCLTLPVALATAIVSVAGDGIDHAPVSFRLRDASDIVVPVIVSGQGPFQFLLDTGSNRSAVTERVASELRLPGIGDTVVVSPSGRRTRRLVRAVIEFGGARTILSAMVLPSGDFGQGIEGAIGTDVLATRRFTIDYVGRRVCFEGPDRRERGTAMSLTHGRSGFLVTVPERDGQPPLHFIPDTGTAGFVLFARDGRQLPGITPLAPVPLRTVGGLKVGRSVLLEQLHVGNIQVRNQLAVVMSGGTVDERLADGLLPLHLFAQVSFDAAGGSLTIVPRR